MLRYDQGDTQDDGEEGDDHQHLVDSRVSSFGCNCIMGGKKILKRAINANRPWKIIAHGGTYLWRTQAPPLHQQTQGRGRSRTLRSQRNHLK